MHQRPITEDLMEAIRQNLISLEEWLGAGYAQAKNHNHDDVNSKAFVLVADVVARTQIDHASTEASWSIAQSDNRVVPEGFYISIWDSSAADGSLQTYINGAWRTISANLTSPEACVYSDGINIRVLNTNSGAGIIVYFRRMDV